MPCLVHGFFIDFSWKNDPKIAQSTKNGFLHKNRQRIHLWDVLFGEKLNFYSIWAIPLGPGGPRGTSQGCSRSLPFLHQLSVASQNRSRPGPGRPQTSSRHVPGMIFSQFSTCFLDQFPYTVFQRCNFRVNFRHIFWINFRTQSFSDATSECRFIRLDLFKNRVSVTFVILGYPRAHFRIRNTTPGSVFT